MQVMAERRSTVFSAVCLFVCERDNSKSYGWIFYEISGLGGLWTTDLIKSYKLGLELTHLLLADNNTKCMSAFYGERCIVFVL